MWLEKGNGSRSTGKERDDESGLDYFGARYYSNALGRFTSTDPKMINGKRMLDPQQLNMYSYVRNNSLIYVDPDGRDLNLWLVVRDEKARNDTVTAATKIANDFHRWGVREVHVHVTSGQAPKDNHLKGNNAVVVTLKNDPSMTKSAVHGAHYPLSGTATVNTGLATKPVCVASCADTIRNATDHEVIHDAQPYSLTNPLSTILGLDHNSDPKDVMYAHFEPDHSKDPQVNPDEQKMLQEQFNRPGDKDQVTVVDEDQKKNKEPK